MQESKTYVVYVGGGQERRTMRFIERFVMPGLYTEVYSPTYKREYKIKGSWHTVEELLVPGYLFIATSDITTLHRALLGVPALTKLLRSCDAIVALTSEELAKIEWLTMPHQRTVGLSQGHIAGEKVVVTHGPLRGHESEIVRIDRHKRLAYLKFHIMGREKNITVGLEVVSKVRESSHV